MNQIWQVSDNIFKPLTDIKDYSKMSQTPITVTYDIKELFTNLESNINKRFDKLETKVDRLEEKVTTLEVEVRGIKEEVKGIKENVGKLEKKIDEIDGLKESISNLTGASSFIKPVIVGILSAIVVVLIRAIPYKF